MTKDFKGSLRLDWINKDKSLYYEIDESEGRGIKPVWVDKNDIKVSEPRILNFVKSYGDENNENMLIRGDNLLVLKTLVEQFKTRKEKDKVKCIYIDPPYNTGSAFEKYDDNLSHSEWLTMMRDRLILLKKLLRKDGAIFIQIDDEEMAYLKILMDEIFGRENFVNCICVKMSEATGVKMAHVERRLPKLKEYILFYRLKTTPRIDIDYVKKERWDKEYHTLLQGLTKEEVMRVKEIRDNENRSEQEIMECDDLLSKFQLVSVSKYLKDKGISTEDEIESFLYENAWRIVQIASIPGSGKKLADSKRKETTAKIFSVVSPNKKMYFIKNEYDEKVSIPRIKVLFADDYLTMNPGDFWHDIKTTGLDNESGVDFRKGKKPERLVWRIINMCSNQNDLVLDSFAGSGTTGAVAHKMKRRWILIEIGKHAEELCYQRLKEVIDGIDLSGISKEVNWKGGGGFKFYKLGESLITGNDINWNLTYRQIAEALFYTKNFKLIDEKELEKKNIFMGENLNEKGTFALCIVSKNCESIKAEEYFELVTKLKESYNFEELNIYTNKAVNVRKIDQEDNVFIRKIPQTILRRYGLI